MPARPSQATKPVPAPGDSLEKYSPETKQQVGNKDEKVGSAFLPQRRGTAAFPDEGERFS